MNKTSKKSRNKRLLILTLLLTVVLVALLLLVWFLENGAASRLETTDLETTGGTETVENSTGDVYATEDNITVETEPEVDAPEPGSITYAQYLALPVEVQQAYYHKFESPEAFFLWLDAAKKEHESGNAPSPTLGDEETEPTEGDIVIDDEEVEDW